MTVKKRTTHEKGKQAASLNAKEAKSVQAKKILIVEDEHMLSEMYASWLKKRGYHVEVAEDGLIGIEKAFRLEPDLILLDVLLPKKDGFEVLTEIRRNPRYRTLPVIILSSLDQDFEQRQGISLGATSYLVKTSVSPEILFEAVEKNLAK